MRAVEPTGAKPLTNEELEVLALLITGVTDDVAAMTLGVSDRTIRARLRSAMDKLGARSRVEVGYLAAKASYFEGA